MPQVESGVSWPRWLPSLGLVVALHVIVWWGYTHFKDEILPPRPLPVVQVSLMTPSIPLEPRVVPPKPLPQKIERRPQSVQPVVEHAVQQAPVTPTPVAAPPAPPVAAPAPVVEPVLEAPRYNAAYLSNPPPTYPLSARRRGVEGTVLVRAEVAANGECLRAELKKSSGAEMLDLAALEAVRKWRFVPAKRGSQAVVAWVEVPITFKLENN